MRLIWMMDGRKQNCGLLNAPCKSAFEICQGSTRRVITGNEMSRSICMGFLQPDFSLKTSISVSNGNTDLLVESNTGPKFPREMRCHCY